MITFLSPGLRFFHQGQLEGRRKRISPHLCRGPAETTDQQLQEFYDRLLAILRQPVVREGHWQFGAPAWEATGRRIVSAFAWHGRDDARLLVVVNYAPNQSQGYVRLPFADLSGSAWLLQDQLSATSYERDGSDLQSRGLYVDAPPWQSSVFALNRSEALR